MPADKLFLDGLTVRPFSPALDAGAFNCNPEINWFLSAAAHEYQLKRLSSVYCWLDHGKVAGYIALAMSNIVLSEHDDRMSSHLVGVARDSKGTAAKKFPALLIGMLGVSIPHRGKGLGRLMVDYAGGKALALSDEVGCRFVVVDADNTAEALGLYDKARFKRATPKDPKKARTDTVLMYFDLGPR